MFEFFVIADTIALLAVLLVVGGIFLYDFFSRWPGDM
jgi:hypothetical protein